MTTVQPGAAGRYADGVYDRNAPGQRAAGDAYVRASGYSSNEERLVDQALASALTTPDQLRAQVDPRKLFPPRFGYDNNPLTINDVVMVNRRYPDSSAQFSGSSGSYSGTTGPSMGWW